MTVWEELKAVLARLRDEQPGSLTQYPAAEPDEPREPPFTIHLAPWATVAAEDLRQQFGESVDLTVGGLPYPPGRQSLHPPGRGPSAELLDPHEMMVELDGPAKVRSGHTLRHGLLVRNVTSKEQEIATNGQITAEVVDPQTGAVVGGFSGAQRTALIIFRVPPGQTERLPLLIGTASATSRIGYTIPAGIWGVQATLTLGPDFSASSPRRRTPILPLAVTP